MSVTVVAFVGKIYIFACFGYYHSVDCKCNLGTTLVPLMGGECQS